MFIVLMVATRFVATGKEDPKYAVSSIPENMKTGVYAVIREEEDRFEINAVNSATTYYRIVITILNSKASDYASMSVPYDKSKVIKNFRGVAYDEMGNVLKKVKQSDIHDRAAFDGYSLYSDSRIKYADLSQGQYPYTVEFEYEVDEKGFYEVPDFELYSDDEIAIQKKTFTVSYVPALKPRYKLFKIEEPVLSKVDSKESMTWTFNNIKPGRYESLSPDSRRIIPNITVSPVEFELAGYRGRMDTWKDFGLWQLKVNEGRDQLPEQTKQKLMDITKNAKSTEEKTQILYKYLQNKTRYVSIQLGIGGLQPFPATDVDRTGYGDCKALSNYMVSMLRQVGVQAYYTQIMAGDDADEVDPAFPCDRSNHIIVAVPNVKDTIWLECTSQINPFGYLGKFTGDRYGLMITEEGGKLVKTPSYTELQNIQKRSADVYIDMNGDASMTVTTSYRGIQYENGDLNFIVHKPAEDQKKWIQSMTPISSFDITSFRIENIEGKIPEAIVHTEMKIRKAASVSGKRIFVTPNVLNKSTFVPEKLETRRNPVSLKYGQTDLDTIRYHLPEGIYPEFLPEPVKVKSRFGEYEASFQVDAGSLVYIRRMRQNKGEYPADSYKELTEFYRNINKADNAKLVFMSKT
jgi:transglutaminase-like putative cysteine protease